MLLNTLNCKLFITGTDTGIGKTYLSIGLLKLFNKSGYSTLAIKPLASRNDNHLTNDVLVLRENSSIKLDYHLMNAFTFSRPIAPHIAASHEGIKLSAEVIANKLAYALNNPAQIKIIEGIGGWHVPLNDKETMEDIVRILKLDVILAVGIRLGCLNHALLSAHAIKTSGVNFVGWIANCIDPLMPFQMENIDTLKKYIDVPHLGTVSHHQKPEKCINIHKIMANCSR
ncbi:MAG TPA: dethiobiotin synthase [Gammaproteobacteria bacterium]|nr:dethiobiotin synthase [Gammaproteobacteria bacterium]